MSLNLYDEIDLYQCLMDLCCDILFQTNISKRLHIKGRKKSSKITECYYDENR